MNSEILSTIQFSLLGDGTVQIDVEFGSQEEKLSPLYGEFLHGITSGQYNINMLQILYKLISQDIIHKDLIINIVKQWESQRKRGDDEPIVKPLNALKIGIQSNKSIISGTQE